MDEFLKIKWRSKPLSEKEYTQFISEEEINKSYIYKSFEHVLKKPQKGLIKLRKASEKYIPGKKNFQIIKKKSLLLKNAKESCFTAIKLFHSGKDLSNMSQQEKECTETYNKLHHLIVKENQLFQNVVKRYWEEFGFVKVAPTLRKYSENFWSASLNRYLTYPKYYKEHSSLGLVYDEAEGFIEYECINLLQELGTLARYVVPCLGVQCLLTPKTLPKIPKTIYKNSQLPVSQDKNIESFIMKYKNIDVVISSSGLKQIMDNTDPRAKWIIPVIIKNVNRKKIVFIDKRLPKTNPDLQDLRYFAFKNLVKTNFCEFEAFSYNNEGILIENNLNDETQSDEAESNCKQILHNVNYRLWKIKNDNSKTLMKNKLTSFVIHMLVRSKLDACEKSTQQVLQPVVIRPKVEAQVQYGANIATKSELSREWTSLFFRPFSNLYRIRINPIIGEVIATEKCTLQKINTEAHAHYEFKPNLGLGFLYKVINELMKLEEGNYLLQHLPKHENFVSILKECDEKSQSFNLQEEFHLCNVDYDSKPNWIPIDVNFFLPVHNETHRLPAMFEGFDKKKEPVVYKFGVRQPKTAFQRALKRKRRLKRAKKAKEEAEKAKEEENEEIPYF